MRNILAMIGLLGGVGMMIWAIIRAAWLTFKRDGSAAKAQLKWIFYGLVLIIIGVIAVPASNPNYKAGFEAGQQSAKETASQKTPQEQPKPEAPQKPQYPFTATVDGTKYKGKIASDVGVAVVKTEVKQSIGGQFIRADAEGKFVLIMVGVGNFQKDAITIDANSFQIIANGKEFDHSTEGTTALMASDYKTFFLKKVNPDMSTFGWLIFDVPKNLDLSIAQLRFRGGFTGKTETLPLQPIKE